MIAAVPYATPAQVHAAIELLLCAADIDRPGAFNSARRYLAIRDRRVAAVASDAFYTAQRCRMADHLWTGGDRDEYRTTLLEGARLLSLTVEGWLP